jgi:DNA-binding NarL/FixJ family response regulator
VKAILIVDDLADARALLRAAVAQAFPGAACVGAENVAEAHARLAEVRFDLALVDLALPDGNGVEVIETLSRCQPGCEAVVATIHDDDDNLFGALQAGARGYLLKDQPVDWLARQLRGIADGQPPLSPAIARRLMRHFQEPKTGANLAGAPLSEREREVLQLLGKGIRIADIAARLGISRHTAGDHVKNIYRKLNISSRAEAALHARGLGLV